MGFLGRYPAGQLLMGQSVLLVTQFRNQLGRLFDGGLVFEHLFEAKLIGVNATGDLAMSEELFGGEGPLERVRKKKVLDFMIDVVVGNKTKVEDTKEMKSFLVCQAKAFGEGRFEKTLKGTGVRIFGSFGSNTDYVGNCIIGQILIPGLLHNERESHTRKS